MEKRVKNKTKRRLKFLVCTILLLVSALVVSVYKDLMQVLRNKNEISLLTEQYNSLLHDEESLQSEITKLQDSDYVARYAREKWLYTLPDEIIIKLPDNKE